MNEDLKKTFKQKIQDSKVEATDLADFFMVICQLVNDINDIQDEAAGWDCKIQFNLEGAGHFWISVSAGKFSTGEGEIENANLTLALTAREAAQIFTGEKDAEAALKSGALKIHGDLPDAIKFYEVLELVLEEIEN